MVEGVVNSRLEAIVTLMVKGPSGKTQEIKAVIDTGFSESLTVPPEIVAALELDHVTVADMVLADGSMEKFDVFKMVVMWDGNVRQIEAHESNAIPLIGMGLMEGNRLTVDVEEGGRALIEAKA